MMEDPQYFPGSATQPFSLAVQCGDVLYCSGQIGRGSDGRLSGDLASESEQAMNNIVGVLASARCTMADVIKCTIMLADMSRWAEFNVVYLRYFDAAKLPARSAFGVNGLAGGALVEIECWARIPRA